MMTYKFTSRAENALEIANELAIELNHNYIGTEHLLYGVIKEGSGVASKVLEKGRHSYKILLEYFKSHDGNEDKLLEKTGIGIKI